ncbi:TIR domain-containing protein [Caenimonas sedimenti]|uniref:TIR domain-containing protein n=1 Tax=Caenimonas sedimenti TaxID=2596921 RepID=A0A562ZFF8_9BURK|nr:FxsC protein [Caenimonas sedimenti]TWO65499.1 TIR domain-containing protein [Caenimonas sedimenti]
MAYEFFFSYSRSNNNEYLQTFFENLSEAVREELGKGKGEVVGFFDQRDIELGEDWDQKIFEALQDSKVMVAVGSPGYFKSIFCGKEWELFRQRCAKAVQSGAPPPPLIKPVTWIAFKIEELPAVVRAGQAAMGDPQALHNVKGLKLMLQSLTKYSVDYHEYIAQLAREIVKAGREHTIPRLAAAPSYTQMQPAFPAAPSELPLGGAAPAVLGPKHIRVVYVAANPQQLAGARTLEPYLDSGASDWKPFLPMQTTRIHAVFQHLASAEGLGFTSEELSFGPTLVQEVQKAWNLRQIVILLVDGWTLSSDANYRAILQQLDQRLDVHWCVLVPWNEEDHDSMANRPQIELALQQTFYLHRHISPNPMFYREGIRSPDELQQALRDVLTRLKEEVRKRAEIEMPVPAGPSKYVISAGA